MAGTGFYPYRALEVSVEGGRNRPTRYTAKIQCHKFDLGAPSRDERLYLLWRFDSEDGTIYRRGTCIRGGKIARRAIGLAMVFRGGIRRPARPAALRSGFAQFGAQHCRRIRRL
jgi:hypothetical protein